MSRRMQTSWKLFLHTAGKEMAEPQGTGTSEAAGKGWATLVPQLRMHHYPQRKPPHLTVAVAGRDRAERRDCQTHRDVLKKVEATSREEPEKSINSKQNRKARWQRAGRCSQGLQAHLALAQPSFEPSWSHEGDVL